MNFEPGYKCFAKLKGYPPWPARINPLPSDIQIPRGKVPIFFYGTHDIAMVHSKDITDYEKNKLNYSHLEQKNPRFKEAMIEIDDHPTYLQYGLDPNAIAFLKRFFTFKGANELSEEVEIDTKRISGRKRKQSAAAFNDIVDAVPVKDQPLSNENETYTITDLSVELVDALKSSSSTIACDYKDLHLFVINDALPVDNNINGASSIQELKSSSNTPESFQNIMKDEPVPSRPKRRSAMKCTESFHVMLKGEVNINNHNEIGMEKRGRRNMAIPCEVKNEEKSNITILPKSNSVIDQNSNMICTSLKVDKVIDHKSKIPSSSKEDRTAGQKNKVNTSSLKEDKVTSNKIKTAVSPREDRVSEQKNKIFSTSSFKEDKLSDHKIKITISSKEDRVADQKLKITNDSCFNTDVVSASNKYVISTPKETAIKSQISPSIHDSFSLATPSQIISEADDDDYSTIVRQFSNIDKEIKRSLIVGQENFDKCIEQLQGLLQISNVSIGALCRMPDIVDTIKKCRRYKKNETIKNRASIIFKRFLKIFSNATMQEKESAGVALYNYRIANLKQPLSLLDELFSSDSKKAEHGNGVPGRVRRSGLVLSSSLIHSNVSVVAENSDGAEQNSFLDPDRIQLSQLIADGVLEETDSYIDGVVSDIVPPNVECVV